MQDKRIEKAIDYNQKKEGLFFVQQKLKNNKQ